jgi:hypothetical protein
MARCGHAGSRGCKGCSDDLALHKYRSRCRRRTPLIPSKIHNYHSLLAQRSSQACYCHCCCRLLKTVPSSFSSAFLPVVAAITQFLLISRLIGGILGAGEDVVLFWKCTGSGKGKREEESNGKGTFKPTAFTTIAYHSSMALNVLRLC